jgi:MarR family transcriptional regulator, lower aerobic nicotinate degradation pathway regulator
MAVKSGGGPAGDSPAAGGALTADPGYLLSRVGTAVQTGFKEVLGGWQIRPLHFLILITLRARDALSQQDLCRTTRVDSGNMVDLIDTLERLGYAVRQRDPADRRRHLISLTETGRAEFTAMTEAVSRYNTRFLAPLDPAEQATLVTLLARLYVTIPESQEQSTFLEPGRTTT